MAGREVEPRPAADRPAPQSTVRRSYCRAEGWKCQPGDRCDEHRKPPMRVGEFLRTGDWRAR